MIVATADQVASILAADMVVLRELRAFIEAATLGDDDISAILGALPARIAQGSPFADEAALTETVKRETLLVLHALALRRMPAMGRA
jgi:hypothetical protein